MYIACARYGAGWRGGNPWRPDDSERNPRLQKTAIWEQRRGSFCLKGGSTGPWWRRWRWGAPSLFRGPGFFLSETATWGKRRRLGRKARRDFLSNGPGPVGLQQGELSKRREGEEPEKILAVSGIFAKAKPAPRLLSFWSWNTEGPMGSLPGGKGPCKGGRGGAAGRAEPTDRPAHYNRGGLQR